MILFARLLCGEIFIEVEDPDVGQSLARLFLLQYSSSASRYVRQIVVTGKGSFSIAEDGILVSGNLSFGDLALTLDRMLECVVRAAEIPGAISLHASSALMDGKAISFVGLSGSGKTTFALKSSRHGDGFLGDEYAWLNTTRCCLSHELAPVHIKNSGLFQAKSMGFPVSEVVGADGFRVNYADPRSVGLVGEKAWLPLRALVFPCFDEGRLKTEIRAMSVVSFAQKLAESAVVGVDGPRVIRRMWQLIGSGKVRVVSVAYSNVREACKLLLEDLKL